MMRTNSAKGGVIALTFGWVLSVCAALVTSPALGDDVPPLYVIAHPSVVLTEVDRQELNNIFTARRQFDDRNQRLIPLNLPPGHPVRVTFDHAVLGMTQDQAASFWIDQRIRGDARAPRQVTSPELLARVVAQLAGSVGYVASVPSGLSVQIVAVIEGGERIVAPN